jgi:hypothetical protein
LSLSQHLLDALLNSKIFLSTLLVGFLEGILRVVERRRRRDRDRDRWTRSARDSD